MTRLIRVSWAHIIHAAHCCALLLLLAAVGYAYVRLKSDDDGDDFDMYSAYGCGGTVVVVLLYFGPIVPILVMSAFNAIGIIIYNCFRNDVKLRASPDESPFVCFRTVTRGNYPTLVKTNAARNRDLCLQVGLKNFEIEIVTDAVIDHLPDDKIIRQTVVPSGYATRKGSLYKARALQYALEEGVNALGDDDWIVHLDEESLLTANSVKGILNFISDGRYQLGQGLVTYANENVVNWVTTFMDAYRVADDLGKLRFQMKFLHRLFMDWKGSFLVCRAGVEKLISFDNGPEGSIVEDIYFGQKAAAMGFDFDYVEGEVWEKSPFTLLDFAKQRRRWVEGGRLIIYASQLPYKTRIMFAWIRAGTLLIQTGFYYALCSRHLPLSHTLKYAFEMLFNVCMALFVYMHVLGAIKSYTLYPKNGWKHLLLGLLGTPVIVITHGIIYTAVVISTMFSKKAGYEIVHKNHKQLLLDV